MPILNKLASNPIILSVVNYTDASSALVANELELIKGNSNICEAYYLLKSNNRSKSIIYKSIKGILKNYFLRSNSQYLQHKYTLSFFSIDVEQEIIAIEDDFGRDSFINAGKSSRQGIELSLRSQLSEALSSSLAYTYSDFSYKAFVDKNSNDFSGNKLPGLPKDTLHASIHYQHQAGLFASIETLYLGQFSLDNANTETMDSSLVTDIRGGYNFTIDGLNIEPFIGISNLFNEVYSSNARINAFGGRFYESGPDRNLYAGVSIRHNFTH